jgi:hypothetical protein
MRKAALLAALSLWTAIALGAGKFAPLNIKTGYWESTLHQKGSGGLPITPDMQARLAQMTPQQRAMLEAYMKGANVAVTTPKTMVDKGCWTEKDLQKSPLFGDRCTWTDLTSTGTKLQGKGTCWMDNAKQEKMNVTMNVSVVDSEHVKGTMQLIMSGGGRSLTSDYDLTAKYLGPVCGKNESNMEMGTAP